jgi:hypothetical protein
MIKSHGVRQTVRQEAPMALASLLIAELFYKFHSFILECLAFLATWYVLSFIANKASKLLSRDGRRASHLQLRR